jgi:hypothetical protein
MRKLDRCFTLIIYLEMLRRNKLAVLFTAAINNAAQAQSPGHESNGKNFFASFAYSSRLIAPVGYHGPIIHPEAAMVRACEAELVHGCRLLCTNFHT